jgi:ubiquinone/menaquinone biosynthesis C-methylase UbiE
LNRVEGIQSGLMTTRYEDITETTGMPVTDEAADMLATRYSVAADIAVGARVLELGCAAGQGLGLIAARARFTVGGDYSAALLASARRHYATRIPFVQLSAEALPFSNQSFDVVLFFEATYYVPDMEKAFSEIARVLAPAGTVMFVNANPERPDFIRSPHSTHYHTADEFRRSLSARGFDVATEGAFPVAEAASGASRARARALRIVRQALEALHLVPRTLKGRARLKRLLYGKLRSVPPELGPGFATVSARTPVGGHGLAPSGFKVLYVTGRSRA